MVSFGVEILPNIKIEKLISFAKICEELGFDNIWVADHFNNRNVYPALALIAQNTSMIKIGSGVVNPYHTHPAFIASAIGTINEISNGRAILGIGAGDESILNRIGIKREKPVKFVEESVRIIRKLFSGEAFSYHGSIFNTRTAKLDFKAGDIPIYIGAQGPKMLRLSGRLGDGVLINASHPKDILYSTEQIKEGMREREIDSNFEICVFASVSIDHDSSKAVESAKRIVGFIVASSPDYILERHGIEVERRDEIRDAIVGADFNQLSRLVDDHMVEVFSIAGDEREVRERLFELFDAGAESIAFGSPMGRDKIEALKLLSKICEAVRSEIQA